MSSTPAEYAATPRTTPTRKRDRVCYDTQTVHAILDAEYLCHLGFVADGAPVVLPTLYTRMGQRLYLHGSTGSRPLHAARECLRVCVTVTVVDGLVLARSGFHSSVNYRSVTAHGIAHQVTDPEEWQRALDALVDNVVPGRSGDVRPISAKERAQTAVIRLDLDEVSAKVQSDGVDDEPEDLDLPHWAGVIPVSRTHGPPVPDHALPTDTPLPDYLTRPTRS